MNENNKERVPPKDKHFVHIVDRDGNRPVMNENNKKIVPPQDKNFVHIVDRNGDVIFVVGPDKLKMQVLSSVFGLASPVFKIIFEPLFSEGIKLAKNRAENKTTEIVLPEDHFEAMLCVAKVLHYRTEPETNCIHIDLALEIATVAHKYDLAPSLEYASENWLRKIYDHLSTRAHLDAESCTTLWKLIICATLFRKQEQFREFTRAMILKVDAIETLFRPGDRIEEKFATTLLSTFSV